MRKRILLICLLTVFLPVLLAGRKVYSFGGCESDCQKCHSITKGEVRQILDKMKAGDAKIVDLKMSPVSGLWEVSIEDRGRTGIFYVPFSKKYIVRGAIIDIETSSNRTQETINEISRPAPRYVDVSKIPLDTAILVGLKDAPYKVYVFTDPDCPFCSKLHEEIKKVTAERKDIAFYLKLMPLQNMHPDAYWKSKSIMCGDSLRLLEDNFAKKPIPKTDCDSKPVDDNLKLAAELGITGTPTIIMPDGQMLIGMRDAGTLIEQAVNPKKGGSPK